MSIATSSLFLSEMFAKLERILSSALQKQEPNTKHPQTTGATTNKGGLVQVLEDKH